MLKIITVPLQSWVNVKSLKVDCTFTSENALGTLHILPQINNSKLTARTCISSLSVKYYKIELFFPIFLLWNRLCSVPNSLLLMKVHFIWRILTFTHFCKGTGIILSTRARVRTQSETHSVMELCGKVQLRSCAAQRKFSKTSCFLLCLFKTMTQ